MFYSSRASSDREGIIKKIPIPVLCVILEVSGGDLDILRFIPLYFIWMWSFGVDAQEEQ